MRILVRTTALLVLFAIAAAVGLLWVAPRMPWNADAKPGALERELAGATIDRWVSHNASSQTNPIAPTAENLKEARNEYGEHCAPCHGLDGGAKNGFEASFYPPIPRLNPDAQDMSDGELFFIVSHGVRYSAMPAFGENHSPEEIWKMILWVRHLGKLTPEEKKQIEAQINESTEAHEAVMHEADGGQQHGTPGQSQH